ncbi:lipopolysaccharide kinase InaA family protein [Bacteroides propionicifaciens]|jgi:serine/threonine protein kinase|uniref:lipopolysaccharide kinase InaA family protein n=1 Tax=Bacteroides propionicifaciens TaxID=392838 RepID=UPI00035C6BC1|nr:lipopolysaccharide kinase InaA family protein [Bacteroides propionicifaciens]
MYKRIINSKFNALKPFVDSLPYIFEDNGETIYTGRNLIKVFDVDGLKVNVKRYGIPFFINRVVYSYLRKPKGLRAYTYPSILLKAGVNTPEPIAYIEERKGGLIGYSYFVSLQSSYKAYLYEIGNLEVEEIKELAHALALFTSDMHKKGIYHKDYSPGNILCGTKDGRPDFCLVDINRMRFGEVTLEEGCANFARLWGQPSFFRYIAEAYAKDRGADVEWCIECVFYYRTKFWKSFSKRKTIKYDLKY